MKKINKNTLFSVILAIVMIFSVTACSQRPEIAEDSSGQSSAISTGDGKTFINTLQLPDGPFIEFALPNLTPLVSEKHEINADTVGWLQVPNTTIDDVVVWYPGDKNRYYYRRNFDKKESFNGIFYADYRCKFDGGAAGLAPNTVIYGHSMSDDPLDKRKMFSPLKFYKDQDFAVENPYIYFSIAETDLVWEVFAVFFATVDLPYNHPFPTDMANIISECTKRSIYTYDVQVSATDKILTLSTCTYSMPDGRGLSYPNDYRYVVMAKLVTDTAHMKEQAALELNPSPKAP